MNDILNRGFVSPYIDFRFAAGDLGSEQIIDTVPPKYFASFHQERTVSEACSFTLQLMYVPETFSESDALMMHKMLLGSVKKPVRYRYGYRTPYGGLQLQDQCYCGIFLQYKESLQGGYMTYEITGISREVELLNEKYSIQDYLREYKKYRQFIQPSELVYDLLFGVNQTGLPDFFNGFRCYIDHTDDVLEKNSIIVPDGTISEILIGTYNKDGAYTPGGFSRLSHRSYTPSELLSQGLISQGTYTNFIMYEGITNHGVSTPSIVGSMEYAAQEVARLTNMPFVCYFDNVINSIGDTSKGTFYYVEKQNRTAQNEFIYDFGNSYRNSDVISFTVNLDCTAAKATVPALKSIEGNIDTAGNYIASNNNVVQSAYFVKNTYNTLSGFNEALFLTKEIVSKAFNYPFDATLVVVGQTKCNHLMDTIRVNVSINGVPHNVLTGDYIILGIEEDLSPDGFTTTFKLTKMLRDSEDDIPPVVINGDTSNAADVQSILDNNT